MNNFQSRYYSQNTSVFIKLWLSKWFWVGMPRKRWRDRGVGKISSHCKMPIPLSYGPLRFILYVVIVKVRIGVRIENINVIMCHGRSTVNMSNTYSRHCKDVMHQYREVSPHWVCLTISSFYWMSLFSHSTRVTIEVRIRISHWAIIDKIARSL